MISLNTLAEASCMEFDIPFNKILLNSNFSLGMRFRTKAQADRRLCWSHILHCWKSYALAHFMCIMPLNNITITHLCNILVT